MRQRQGEELQKKGELPVSMMTHVGPDKPISRSGALPPPVATVKRKLDTQDSAGKAKRASTLPDSPEDPFTRAITVQTLPHTVYTVVDWIIQAALTSCFA